MKELNFDTLPLFSKKRFSVTVRGLLSSCFNISSFNIKLFKRDK